MCTAVGVIQSISLLKLFAKNVKEKMGVELFYSNYAVDIRSVSMVWFGSVSIVWFGSASIVWFSSVSMVWFERFGWEHCRNAIFWPHIFNASYWVRWNVKLNQWIWIHVQNPDIQNESKIDMPLQHTCGLTKWFETFNFCGCWKCSNSSNITITIKVC